MAASDDLATAFLAWKSADPHRTLSEWFWTAEMVLDYPVFRFMGSDEIDRFTAQVAGERGLLNTVMLLDAMSGP